MNNIINVSKSIFIVDVAEGYAQNPYFAVYAREVEPEPHNSWINGFECYESAVEYAVEQAVELNEPINDNEIDSYDPDSE